MSKGARSSNSRKGKKGRGGKGCTLYRKEKARDEKIRIGRGRSKKRYRYWLVTGSPIETILEMDNTLPIVLGTSPEKGEKRAREKRKRVQTAIKKGGEERCRKSGSQAEKG